MCRCYTEGGNVLIGFAGKIARRIWRFRAILRLTAGAMYHWLTQDGD